MPQLPLRLVPRPREAPPGGVGGSVVQLRGVPGAAGGEPTVPRSPSPHRATIERLRALVGSRGRVGILPPPREDADAPVLDPGSVSTGVAGLDAWLRGWPRPGPVEIAGRAGAGRLALVAPALARLTREGRTVVIVDPLLQVHPPGLGEVDLARIVLVRTAGERAAWTAEQVARSGAVDALLVLDAPPLGRGGVRLARAAEAGNVLVFVITERPDADLPAALRLEMTGWREDLVGVRCTRSRDGRRVGERFIAPWERPQEPRWSEPARSSQAERSARFRVRTA